MFVIPHAKCQPDLAKVAGAGYPARSAFLSRHPRNGQRCHYYERADDEEQLKHREARTFACPRGMTFGTLITVGGRPRSYERSHGNG